MQSSMWKLLTAAGIIGIGTLVVLEVQNRLPMASHTSAPTEADTIGTVTSADTDVIPDATVDFDRMLAGSDAVDDPQFALNEPNAPDDTGTPVPPADDQNFVGMCYSVLGLYKRRVHGVCHSSIRRETRSCS